MDRVWAVTGSIVFFFLAPGTVAFLAPWLLAGWTIDPMWRDVDAAKWAGGALGLAGTAALVECFARLALQGLGTPAPVAPTKSLVVTGLYRHVRNPMYVAVLAIILAQALWFASAAILVYGGLIWLAYSTFVALYEEPTLRRSYGARYETYCANVGRWIPRVSAWRP